MPLNIFKIRQLSIISILLFCATLVKAQSEITWTEEYTLTGTFKYIRLCKVTKGIAVGDIIMTYFQSDHSAPFGMRRSKDQGRTWSNETIFMTNDATYYYVNPSILQLDDGRLMLSYCKRSKLTPNLVSNEGPCVKFSTDGGYTWGAETFICWGGAYEPTTIQVPNDKNGDGNNDIYLFWSMAIINQSYDLSVTSSDTANRGFACGVVASYDNGKTWNNFMPTKLGARIVHRNFNEPASGTFLGSKGNMPTPVLLPNHRIGVACEAVDKSNSPWFTVSDENDWDWENFQGQQWSSYTYFGYPPYSANDQNVYPTDRNKCWRPTYTDSTFGGAPYTCVLPNGKIAFSQNSGQNINVFVGDAYGKNSKQQTDPFQDKANSFYSCIISLNDHEVIVAAHDNTDMTHAYIRIGEITKDTQAPTQPKNVTWTKIGDNYQVNWTASTDNIVVYKYEVYVNGTLVKTVLWDNFATISGLDNNVNYTFTIRAIDYQGNYSQLSTGLADVIQSENVNIFPNPAKSQIQIQTSFNDYSTVIMSIDGKKLITPSVNAKSVDISGLRNGIYFISIEQNGTKITKKFIKSNF